MIKIRVAVIIVKDGRVLLARHKRGDFTYWVLPGGTAEEGECLHETGRREIKEETALDVALQKLAFVGEVMLEKRELHIIDFFFTGVITNGELHFAPQDSIQEIRFFTPQEASTLLLLPDGIKAHLLEGLKNGFGQTKYLTMQEF